MNIVGFYIVLFIYVLSCLHYIVIENTSKCEKKINFVKIKNWFCIILFMLFLNFLKNSYLGTWFFFTFDLLKYRIDIFFYQKPTLKLMIEAFLLIKKVVTDTKKLMWNANMYRFKQKLNLTNTLIVIRNIICTEGNSYKLKYGKIIMRIIR